MTNEMHKLMDSCSSCLDNDFADYGTNAQMITTAYRRPTICTRGNTSSPTNRLCNMYINDIAGGSNNCRVDVIFVLDESLSIGRKKFGLMMSFLSQLVGRLDIDNGQTRLGLVTYSTTIDEAFDLNAHSSVAAVQSAISSLTYSGGVTWTHKALRYVHTKMLTSAAGDRSDVHNVVVVKTDGKSFSKEKTKVFTNHNVEVGEKLPYFRNYLEAVLIL